MPTRVDVNPDVLIWFRKDAGFHDVISLPKSIRDNVIKWESGEKKPTWNQLRELGDKYKRPATFFLMENPKESFTEEFADYRTITDSTSEKSPNFIYEIRRAIKRRNILLDLLDSDYNLYSPPILDIKNDDSEIESLAYHIKKILDVDIQDQIEWSRKDNKHYYALREWKNTVESLNILIFESRGVSVDEFRGITISEFPFPIILLNGSDSPNARIFTLIHELIHIFEKTSAICDLTEHDRIEAFCNKLTGEILVPKNLIEEMDIVIENESMEWNDTVLRGLSNYFGVSRDVILTRLLILKRTSQNFYNATLKRWKEESKTYPKQSGGSFDYKTIIKLNGRLFTKQMVNAYEKELINSVEFSRFMGGIKLKHVPDLIENVGGQ